MTTNQAVDPRRMRRIIAEDPEWNLETVPPLVELCTKHIVDNFHEHPVLDELIPKHRQLVLAKLPTTVPLEVTAPLVEDEGYWECCCKSRWRICDASEYDGRWKKMFFERHVAEEIEKFVPEQSDIIQLERLLSISSSFVESLKIHQLLPPKHDTPLPTEEDGDDTSEDFSIKVCNDHLDMAVIFKHLKKLKQLKLVFGVNNCGMNFDWSLFEFTRKDCLSLGKAVKGVGTATTLSVGMAMATLSVLRVCRSKMTDERGRLLVSHLLDHPSLSVLDLSHNRLGDGTGRALGKLLNHHSHLTKLDVAYNRIGEVGGASIGHALQGNATLKELNLRMNNLGDKGAQSIVRSMKGNACLTTLNLSSNRMGQPSASIISEMLIANKTLLSFIISCNNIGEMGGSLLLEGMEENSTLQEFDLRLTEISQESEYRINELVKSNQDAIKTTPHY